MTAGPRERRRGSSKGEQQQQQTKLVVGIKSGMNGLIVYRSMAENECYIMSVPGSRDAPRRETEHLFRHLKYLPRESMKF